MLPWWDPTNDATVLYILFVKYIEKSLANCKPEVQNYQTFSIEATSEEISPKRTSLQQESPQANTELPMTVVTPPLTASGGRLWFHC